MSEKKNESIAEKKISRRSMLKWTGAIAATAIVAAGVGFEASQLLKPTAPPAVTTTATATTTSGVPTALTEFGEQVCITQWKEEGILQAFVKDGRITRTEPYMGFPTYQQNLGERYRVYDPNRVQYPMKRNGWAPGGTSPIGNRGKGDFVRITWEEAYSSITSELKRIINTYGPSAILVGTHGAHSDSWMFHNRWFFPHNFLSLIGGYTTLLNDGYSWGASRSSGNSIMGAIESASPIAPGEQVSWFLKYSKMIIIFDKDPIVNDMLMIGPEIADDARLFKQAGIKIVRIGADQGETGKLFADTWIPCHSYGGTALMAAIAYTWITEGTYDQAYLDTHTVGFDEDHMPAGAPAGASFKNYILGLSDGVKKTAEWAEPICGVKARVIRALARGWASQPTGVWAWKGSQLLGGQYVRFVATLLAMQGLGKPGVGFYTTTSGEGGRALWRDGVKGYPSPFNWGEVGLVNHETSEQIFGTWPYGDHAIPGKYGSTVYLITHNYPVPLEVTHPHSTGDYAHVPNPVDTSYGGTGTLIAGKSGPMWGGLIRDTLFETSMNASPDKPVYNRYTLGMDTVLSVYPAPGNSEVHMYLNNRNWPATQPDCNMYLRALLSPKFEFILRLAQYMDTDAMYADILLPTCTNMERADFTSWGLYQAYTEKVIDPLFESKSDFDIFMELSNRMGVQDKYIKGPGGPYATLPTEDDWLHAFYDLTSTLPNYLSYDDFKKQKVYYFKPPDDWHSFQPMGWNWQRFWQDPARGLPSGRTESGLIEIYSQSTIKIAAMGQSGYYLARDPKMADPMTQKYESPNPGPDPLAPGLPTYIPNPEGPGTPTAQKYPIAIQTNHPKFAYHASYQNVLWLQKEWKMNIGGYSYAPILINSSDASARGIKYGDLVRVFNDRGQVLAWANVSERIMPGVACLTYGEWGDYAQPGVPGSLDKSGNANNLTSGGFISPYDTWCMMEGVAQVEKYTGAA